MHKERTGFIFGFLAAFSNAILALLIKWTQEVPNEMLVFTRFAICLLCFLPRIWQKKVLIHGKYISKHLLRSLAGVGSVYCYFYSLEHLPLVNAVTLSNTFVLFLPILIFFAWRKIIPKMRIVAILVGFLGIVLILRPSEGFSEGANLIGLLGGALAAVATLGIRHLSKIENTETILVYYFLLSTIASFVPMLLSWEPISNPVLWLNLLLIGLCSIVYQYCLTKSLTHAPATKVSTLNYLNVVFSGCLGWWFFAEVPTFWVIVGSLLVIGGGLMAILSKQESKPY